MIQQLAWSVTNLFIRKEEIPAEDGEIYAFGFECMLSTAIQMVLLFIVGILFGRLVEIALYTACFTAIKRHIGGWHADSHFTCISGYTVIALGAVSLCRVLPEWASIFFVIIALALVLALAPIPHMNNPKTKTETAHARKVAVGAAIILATVICIVLLSPIASYAVFGACGLFVAAVSLLFDPKERGVPQ